MSREGWACVRRTVLGVALSLTLFGCDDKNTLSGSIANGFDLSFDDVRAYWMGQELTISYQSTFRPKNNASLGNRVTNQAARLMLDASRQALTAGVDIPLVTAEQVHIASVDHYRVVEDDSGNLTQTPNFPNLQEGVIHFARINTEVDKPLEGRFDCEFVDGRLLTGEFATKIGNPR